MTKLTNKVALETAMVALTMLTERDENASTNFSNAEIAEKLNGMIAQLEKRADAPKRPTKTQQENVGHKAVVQEVLVAAGKALTVSELQAMDERLSSVNMSNPKVAALLRMLVSDGVAVKETSGRKTVFRAV